MKIGIIRCRETEDFCPATTDFVFAKEKKGAFANLESEVEIIAMLSCGGCPGKRAVLRAKEMKKRGAEAIFLASCIKKGTPLGFPCPNFVEMKKAIELAVGEDVKIYDYTH